MRSHPMPPQHTVEVTPEFALCPCSQALCYVMKVGAHVLQQKIFGECMGSSLSVRALVGVNSSLIQAVKYELMKPGVSLSKVCIMCGGPDWPTSVLCGILRNADRQAKLPERIKTGELCLCLAPMIVLILPTVMTAAFQLRTGSPYAAVASVSLVCCSQLPWLALPLLAARRRPVSPS